MDLSDLIWINGIAITRQALLGIATHAPASGAYTVDLGACVNDVSDDGRVFFATRDGRTLSCAAGENNERPVHVQVAAEVIARSRDALATAENSPAPGSELAAALVSLPVVDPADGLDDLFVTPEPEPVKASPPPSYVVAAPEPGSAVDVAMSIMEDAEVDLDIKDFVAMEKREAERLAKTKKFVWPAPEPRRTPLTPDGVSMPYMDTNGYLHLAHGSTVFKAPDHEMWKIFIMELVANKAAMNIIHWIEDPFDAGKASPAFNKDQEKLLENIVWADEGIRFLFRLFISTKQGFKIVKPHALIQSLQGKGNDELLAQLSEFGLSPSGPPVPGSLLDKSMRVHSTWRLVAAYHDGAARHAKLWPALCHIEVTAPKEKLAAVAAILAKTVDTDRDKAKATLLTVFTRVANNAGAGEFLLSEIEKKNIDWAVVIDWFAGDNEKMLAWINGPVPPYHAGWPNEKAGAAK